MLSHVICGGKEQSDFLCGKEPFTSLRSGLSSSFYFILLYFADYLRFLISLFFSCGYGLKVFGSFFILVL